MLEELLVVPPGGEPYRVPLSQEVVTIGRAPVNTIPVQEAMVSRQHAVIQKRDGEWFLADLGSRNGTLVNGLTFQGQRQLQEGDRIQIGGLVVICGGGDEAPRLKAAEPAAVTTRSVAGGPLEFPGRRSTVTAVDPAPFAYGRASALFRGRSETGEDVCVKLFAHGPGEQWHNLSGFEREVSAQSSLDHPNILPVVDWGLHSKPHDSPFVVLPYCPGGNLRGLLEGRAFLSLATVLPLLEQIAAALDFAHGSGVMHGDIKPENILLSAGRKQAYLSDFGMSSVFAIQERFSTAAPGPPGGTTAYLSREQIYQNQQTPLSDIFALATTTYELLTGKLPFDQSLPAFRQMMAKVKGEVLDPRTFNPLISDEIKAVLLAGLHIDPLQRPRSAAEFCRRLAAGPGPVTATASVRAHRKLFVSYAHADSEWLDRVRVHLRPLERMGLIDLWDDSRIRPGTRWLEEIAGAIESATIALLLVSAHFLASEFCTSQELSRLLERARDHGVRILYVILSPCHIDAAPVLAGIQGVNAPSRTLIEMDPGERERVLARLASEIEQALNAGSRP